MCYRNQDKHRSDGPLGFYADFTYLPEQDWLPESAAQSRNVVHSQQPRTEE